MPKPTLEERYKEELLLSRTILRNEMRKALLATTPAAKRALVATWNDVFRPEIVEELLRIAKNHDAKVRIANWNLEGFDEHRRKGAK